MKKLTLVFIALFAVSMFTTSCRDEADTTEEKMEEMSDDMEDAADDMEDTMEDAADDKEDAADDMGDTEMGTEEGA
jgi:outer membrane lipoprotein-sorting protein